MKPRTHAAYTLAALLALLLVNAGCRSGGKSGGINAPAELKPRIHGAFNQAYADLSSMYPAEGFRPVNFRTVRLTVHIEPVVKYAGRRPLIASRVQGLSLVGAQTQVRGNTVTMWIPADVDHRTLIYEAGRVIVTMHGIHALPNGGNWTPQADQHWTRFPKFFRQKYRTPGY